LVWLKKEMCLNVYQLAQHCLVILFFGKGRYIDSSKVYPIAHTFYLLKKEICQEINILIENVTKDSKLEAKNVFKE